jgi:hypothetical protein
MSGQVGQGAKTIRAQGRVYVNSAASLAAIFTMTPGTVAKWLRHPEAPPKDSKLGYDVEKIREFILAHSDHAGVHRKLGGAGKSGGKKVLTWKDRKDRAGALKAERELSETSGLLVNLKSFDKFCQTTIPETTMQLRRAFESTLPAKLEGQTAARMRQILRTELDKILKRFEGEFQTFGEALKAKARKSDEQIAAGKS